MADGSRVLQMGVGYINECRVLVAYDFAGVGSNGAGRLDILESTGSRSLYLTWDIRHADTDSIKLNDHQMLHRTAPHSTNRLRASTSA